MNHHRPMVYAGESCSTKGLERLRKLGWGQCCTTGPTESQELTFFMDNGAWIDFVTGSPFSGDRFLRRMEAAHERDQKPDFVVIPDVVANAPATLEMSARWHPLIPDGWGRYFALQDGITPEEVTQFLEVYPCEGLFIGGTGWFKNNRAAFWTDFAHAAGIKSHYARAGTIRKFEHAMVIGADSLDSSRLSRDGSRWSDFSKCRDMWLNGPRERWFCESHVREIQPAKMGR